MSSWLINNIQGGVSNNDQCLHIQISLQATKKYRVQYVFILYKKLTFSLVHILGSGQISYDLNKIDFLGKDYTFPAVKVTLESLLSISCFCSFQDMSYIRIS